MQGYGSDEMGAAEAKIIAEMLKVNVALTSLNLRYNEIPKEGAIAIAAALPR